VLGRARPHLVRDGVRPVSQSGQLFREFERRALGLRELRRVAPGGHRDQAVVKAPVLVGVSDRPFDAGAAPVDLAGAHVREIERARRKAALLDGHQQLLNAFPRAGNRGRRVGHPGLDFDREVGESGRVL
jgi:hypothetical protein